MNEFLRETLLRCRQQAEKLTEKAAELMAEAWEVSHDREPRAEDR